MADRAPIDTAKGRDLIGLRHAEYEENKIRWRWLLDTLEGGDRYRQASYGIDNRGLPVRNLIRHKREYPESRDLASLTSTYLGGDASGLAGMVNPAGSPGFGPGTLGSDPASMATDDDYEMRRARTPVPTFLGEVVGIHLGKIYAKEVSRTVPDSMPELLGWLADVNGLGTSIDEWMSETVAPLLLTLGQLDLCFDHPPPRADRPPASRLDVMDQKLDACIAGYLLPENVVWWTLDEKQRYREVLIREVGGDDGDDGDDRWRFWNGEAAYCYDGKGTLIEEHPHRFGRPPILRVFDRRKVRCRNVGHPRHEGIAERQREYYNRDSELILSDTTQAHPLLQGPEDYVQADGSIPVGPAWLLPKKKNTAGASTSYEGFDVVDFPKGGADSLRLNKADIRDDVDRDAGLTKPAGASGSTRGAVAQSGISKQMDMMNGNTKLTDQAKILARAERQILALVLTVLADDPAAAARSAEVIVEYPMVFDLSSAQEYTADWAAFQVILESATSCVETQVAVLSEAVRKILPGRSDDFYAMAEEELREKVQGNVDREAQAIEAELNPPEPPPVVGPDGPLDSIPNLLPPVKLTDTVLTTSS